MRRFLTNQMSEKEKDETKRQVFMLFVAFIALLLVVLFSFRLIQYGDYKTNNIYFEVTVNGETHQCNNYKLSDDNIVLYTTKQVTINRPITYTSSEFVEIESKSDVEIKELKYEDEKDFLDWLFYAENKDVEWGK